MMYPSAATLCEYDDQEQIPEIVEREAQELSDMLTELIEKAKALKRRLGCAVNRDSNSLGGISLASHLPR